MTRRAGITHLLGTPPPARVANAAANAKVAALEDGAHIVEDSGSARHRASSRRPELSGGAERLTIPADLTLGKTKVYNSGSVLAAGEFISPSFLVLLGLVSQFGAADGDALTLLYLAVAIFTSMVPQSLCQPTKTV